MSPWILTDLKLSGNASFTLISEVHLCLIILCHNFHKLFGQDGMLGKKVKQAVGFQCKFLNLTLITTQMQRHVVSAHT